MRSGFVLLFLVVMSVLVVFSGCGCGVMNSEKHLGHFRSINGIRRRQLLLVWMICWTVDDLSFLFNTHTAFCMSSQRVCWVLFGNPMKYIYGLLLSNLSI